MQELFPLLAGVLIGLMLQRVTHEWVRIASLIVLSVVVGAIATYISGEWLISWAFIGVDTVLVAVGAIGATAAVTYWQHRTGSTPQ